MKKNPSETKTALWDRTFGFDNGTPCVTPVRLGPPYSSSVLQGSWPVAHIHHLHPPQPPHPILLQPPAPKGNQTRPYLSPKSRLPHPHHPNPSPKYSKYSLAATIPTIVAFASKYPTPPTNRVRSKGIPCLGALRKSPCLSPTLSFHLGRVVSDSSSFTREMDEWKR